MALVALYDACVLFPAPSRDLLIRLATKRLFRAKWTNDILDEVFRNILLRRPELKREQIVRTRTLMVQAIADCLVEGYEPLIPGLTLPDAGDRHVLAAAIRGGAHVIVTANLKDFPDTVLGPLGLEAQHPDEFVLNLIELAPAVVLSTLEEQASALKSPPQTIEQLLATLANNGFVRSVARLRELIAAG